MIVLTKGDWRVTGHVGAGIGIGSSEGDWIAIVYGPGQNSEALANAKAIAAVKDLLGVANDCRSLLESMLAHVSHGGPTRAEGDALLTKVNAVLKRLE